MNNNLLNKIITYVILIIVFIALIGFILPYLISSVHIEFVLFGIILMIIIVTTGIYKILNKIKITNNKEPQ